MKPSIILDLDAIELAQSYSATAEHVAETNRNKITEESWALFKEQLADLDPTCLHVWLCRRVNAAFSSYVEMLKRRHSMSQFDTTVPFAVILPDAGEPTEPSAKVEPSGP